MTHHDFTTTIFVDQTPDEAYLAILNIGGWWTGTNEGRCDELGSTFVHRDGEVHYCQLRVTELTPGRRVTWRVLENNFDFVANQDEWKGTEVTFEIAEAQERTVICFTHRGLSPEFECYGVCSNAWGSLIRGRLGTLISG